MPKSAVVLSVFFGERDRNGAHLRAGALMDVCERHAIDVSVLLRGAEGFGAKHAARTDRLLTLSEDLPMTLQALDSPARIRGLLGEIRSLVPRGLITLEDVAETGAHDSEPLAGLAPHGDAAKLTVIVGRRERSNGRSAHEAVVDAMRAGGMYCATALLGLDGTREGERERARFFGRNTRVPMMIVGVGERGDVHATLRELAGVLPHPTATLQSVQLCKRDGVRLGEPGAQESSADVRLRLSVFAAENVRYEHGTLHGALVRRLREGGAAGASTLRGQWGYDGPGPPAGERIAALGRQAPMITLVIDTPAQAARWFAILDEITGEHGLITSERLSAVPQARSGAGGASR
jgi:PII-like signaling protein